MSELLVRNSDGNPIIPIRIVDEDGFADFTATLAPAARRWIETTGYRPKPGSELVVPDTDGGVEMVLFGRPQANDPAGAFLPARHVGLLPAGFYRFADALPAPDRTALAWALEGYRFDRYTEKPPAKARLVVEASVDPDGLRPIVEGVFLARDLINTPANDLGPAELEMAMRTLGERHGAAVRSVVGEALLAENYPLVHAVGAASDRAPRLVDLSWGDAADPKVTLVGKGVCYDTGGLDIKPSSAMALMKKDMGGAANVIGLAHMIMSAGLKLRLRVIVPAVENSVSGKSFRTGDVYSSRKGLTVEIGNTDAEGRLILADALALADEDRPELIIDMATLTGAARVALGPDLPPFYTVDEALAGEISDAAAGAADPLWRMPLWSPYAKLLDSKIADINHISSGPFAGSITAALFLKRFVEHAPWAHFDIYGWNPSAKPGRPEGGEAQGIRALFALLKARYG